MIDIRRFDSRRAGFEGVLDQLLTSVNEIAEPLRQEVSAIVNDVKRRGDDAVLEYTNRFDRRNAGLTDLELAQQRWEQAANKIDAPLRLALEKAADRIRQYHERQRQTSWTYKDDTGTLLGQQVTAVDRVGVYVPGGKAAYPSSVLMNVIPAVVAGVQEVIMVSPSPDGEINDVVLAAATIAGVDRVFSIGGAQAIAALAYGTGTIPAVDKIVGPGNRYVAEAKRQVFGTVGIDMIAGPSEVLVIADSGADPDWLAMDLFAQAEHDEDARSILVCDESDLLDRVAGSINRMLPDMERSETIKSSLENNGALILVKDLEEAAAVTNRIAPEHLELAVEAPEELLPLIKHAGAIFMGRYSAEAMWDYCAGPNHVLPTAGTARFSSPLGVYDFQKGSSLIMCTAESADDLANIVSPLARSEGLAAHALSAEMRKKDSNN